MSQIIRNIYFKLLSVVYVAPSGKERDPHPQRLVLKLLDESEEKYLGVALESLHVVDDLIEVLERIRSEMDEPSKVHPALKTVDPKKDKTH